MSDQPRRAGARLAAATLAVSIGLPMSAHAAAAQRHAIGAFAAYLSGHFAAQTHDLARAADDLRRALLEDPDVPELASQAFVASLLAGDPQAVRLAATLPTNPLAQLVLAGREARDGHWDAAQSIFAALPQQDPLTQVLRPLLLAWAQQGAGHTDQALATLAPLVAGQRLRAVYALHSALIADLAGRKEIAGGLYEIAEQSFGTSNLRLAVILASWDARQGKLDEARAAIDALANVQSDLAMVRQSLIADADAPAVRSATDGMAEAFLALSAALQQQNVEVAQALIQLSLEMRPDLTPARLLLADIQSGQSSDEAALATLQRIPPNDPLAPLVDLRRAALLDHVGQVEAAQTLLARLAREHPDRPEPLAQQGDILRQQKHFAEAARAYGEAIERVATPRRSDWPLFYARGICFERAGQWVAAEQDLQYALKLAPDQPAVLNYLAYSWAERGENLPEAQRMLERAVVARPNDGAIIDSLGWVLLRRGETTLALQQLQHAAELEPEDPVINGHLGDALAAAGRMREAEYQWRRALTFKPDEEDARKLNEKLAALPGAPAAATPR